ncbi:MAG: glutamine-hydrolyzing GMP synthase [Aerococcus sp.]|nr:glutamine-hydrolyzing GMP synthase [Aerococcus sp.]
MSSIKSIHDVEKIIVLDYGSQYNQLITRRIREIGVYSELKSHRLSADDLMALGNVKGVILSGGPRSVYADDAFDIDPKIFELGIPVLGVCYGMQLMTQRLGGKVEPSDKREYGQQDIDILKGNSEIFHGLADTEQVLMSHSDRITEMPEGFEVTAKAANSPVAAFENAEKQMYGFQFHPETRTSVHGNDMLANFAYRICHVQEKWTMTDFIDLQVNTIREKVGNRKVLLGLSGGVDSSVTGVLLHKAIGDQLVSVFVDHGLLRKGEADQVMASLGDDFGMNIIKVDASERFLTKLKGISDPEQKRKIIGNEFIEVFSDEAKKLDGIDFLAQGTLYTDVIESGTDTAQTIKSHHNVGGLPEDLQFDLIEPLNKLFKDEVREVGTTLGMPDNIVWRQPFPGPGLAIRVIGEVTEEKLHIVRESDAILREEIVNAGLDREIWQYFTVLPGFKSVGVMGDYRTYDYAIAIRAITSVDGMTADWARIPYDILAKISRRIVNEVDGVNRVVVDVTSKPPATVEWE